MPWPNYSIRAQGKERFFLGRNAFEEKTEGGK
jgi:hypothetical protein